MTCNCIICTKRRIVDAGYTSTASITAYRNRHILMALAGLAVIGFVWLLK